MNLARFFACLVLLLSSLCANASIVQITRGPKEDPKEAAMKWVGSNYDGDIKAIYHRDSPNSGYIVAFPKSWNFAPVGEEGNSGGFMATPSGYNGIVGFDMIGGNIENYIRAVEKSSVISGRSSLKVKGRKIELIKFSSQYQSDNDADILDTSTYYIKLSDDLGYGVSYMRARSENDEALIFDKELAPIILNIKYLKVNDK